MYNVFEDSRYFETFLGSADNLEDAILIAYEEEVECWFIEKDGEIVARND